VNVDQTRGTFFLDLGPERVYAVTCHVCGKTGEQVGKELPTGWHWYSNGMVLWYYCADVACWQHSWLRSREEWASA
jgi:hypothetical protein